MSDKTKSIDDPRGRAIAVMKSLQQGNAAKQALIEIGLPGDSIYVLDGRAQASEIDSSAKWFADTDELIQRYKEKLAEGSTLVSAPVQDNAKLEEIQAIYSEAGAHTMTNFGTLVTRTVDLENQEREEPIGQ